LTWKQFYRQLRIQDSIEALLCSTVASILSKMIHRSSSCNTYYIVILLLTDALLEDGKLIFPIFCKWLINICLLMYEVGSRSEKILKTFLYVHKSLKCQGLWYTSFHELLKLVTFYVHIFWIYLLHAHQIQNPKILSTLHFIKWECWGLFYVHIWWM